MTTWVRATMLALLLLAGMAPLVEAAGSPAEILATIDGQPITEADAEKLTGAHLHRARTAYYDARRAAADEVIALTLVEREAKRRGVSVEQLLEAEVTAKIGDISDADVKGFYERNAARIGQPLDDDVKSQIEQRLRQQRVVALRSRLVQELRKSSTIVYLLSPPAIAVAPIGPAKGAATAPVTIVEFSDFECMFCARAQPMLKRLLDSYGASVRFVHRDFPTNNHPAARPAAEAARCADDQGKFWEYHDLLFANHGALDAEALKKYARDISLDEQAFTRCLETRKHRETVDRDLRDGKQAFVSGTPTFFVNGRAIVGAQPADVFRAIIDEELERVRRAQN